MIAAPAPRGDSAPPWATPFFRYFFRLSGIRSITVMSKSPPPKSMKKPARKPSGVRASEESARDGALPGKEEIAAMLAPVRAFAQGGARTRFFLERLAAQPPQVLLLEGGTPDERLAAATYWSLLLNCEKQGPASRASSIPPEAVEGAGTAHSLPGVLPEENSSFSDLERSPEESAHERQTTPHACLECPACIRMASRLHRDCFFFDGLEGSIKIDDVRALRGLLGEPPREARYRTIIFREAQFLVEAAANALLKSLEEPRPATAFVLLAPQRERLLPTLVSRSLVLTLPWPAQEDGADREALASWEATLYAFLRTGHGLFERTGLKGNVDAPLAYALLGLCGRALARRMAAPQPETGSAENLESLLAALPPARLRMLDEALAECQDSLNLGVNPTLVVEWLATRMYLLLPRRRGRPL